MAGRETPAISATGEIRDRGVRKRARGEDGAAISHPSKKVTLPPDIFDTAQEAARAYDAAALKLRGAKAKTNFPAGTEQLNFNPNPNSHGHRRSAAASSSYFASKSHNDGSSTIGTPQYQLIPPTAEAQIFDMATLNRCQTRATGGEDHKTLHLPKEIKSVLPPLPVGKGHILSPFFRETLPLELLSTIMLGLGRLREDLESIEKLFPRRDLEYRVYNCKMVGLTARFDPLVLLEEVKDIYGMDLVLFSALPVNKHMEKDGWHGYCTNNKLEQVLANIRRENALLEAEMEQSKCRPGNNQHVPQECGKMERKPDISVTLPIDCIAHIISFTSPWDACRLSLVCHAFCAAAGMDAVWERFLPTDYDGNISQVNSFSSAKEKFYNLSHKPVFAYGCSMSFLDRRTGKKCLVIWNSRSNRRFFIGTGGFGSAAWFESKLLSPKTIYVAYLVFRLETFSYGCDITKVELVHRDGSGDRGLGHVLLDPPEDMDEVPRERPDGSMEMAMGEFLCDYGEDGARIGFGMMRKATDPDLLISDVIIKGFEFRPKVV